MMCKSKSLTGDELKRRADELGVPRLDNASPTLQNERISEINLQNRVMEAERHIREHRLWVVAVVSMLISLVSVSAAWWAVLHPALGTGCR